jgi:uncharacterized protein (DUF488 family)
MPPLVFTLGHSTRSFDELIALLGEHGIGQLIDVRRYPASRRHPQFGRERLERSLAEAGVGYVHEADLGGHREPRADSPNTAWREEAFRGYADHMASDEFQQALGRVLRRAAEGRIVVMCAEADSRKCHRQVLADGRIVFDADRQLSLMPEAGRG